MYSGTIRTALNNELPWNSITVSRAMSVRMRDRRSGP